MILVGFPSLSSSDSLAVTAWVTVTRKIPKSYSSVGKGSAMG